MADDSTITDPVDWGVVATQVLSALLAQFPDTGVHKSIVNAHADGRATWMAVLYKAALETAAASGKMLHSTEEVAFPFIAAFVAPVVAGLFGAEVDAGTFAQRLQVGGGTAAAQSIVENFLKAVTAGTTNPTEPSDAGSRRIAAAAVGASLESTFNAIATEMISDLLPEIGPHFSTLSELPEGILRTLGVGRLVRRALAPAIDATCATPAKWYYAKLYRQTLLPPGIIAKQVARGQLSQEDAAELLSRHGYRDQDQDAIINDALKFMGAAELYTLVRAGEWGLGDAQKHLTDQGWDDGTAAVLLEVQKLTLIRSFSEELANLAVEAFGAGRIDEGTLGVYVHGTGLSDQDAARYAERAAAKKKLTEKPLTGSEAEAAVMADILAFADYRDALRLENRSEDAITTLELMLRKKYNAAKSVAEHKADQAAEVAAAKADKQKAAAAKQAAHDAAVAQAQRGKPADLKAAYLRGLIPITRVQEAWAPLYDADTVATLTATLEDQRAQLVKQQQARDQAAARAAQRGIPVADLERAVKAGTLGVNEYGDRLVQLGIDKADAALMVATLTAELQKAADAKTLHDQAVAAAKVKHVDLPTLELLVRRGHRTIADFNAALASLGYDDVVTAALDDRLQLQIADDTRAAQVKAAAAAKAADHGLSLAQAERGVILGITDTSAFNTYLIKAGYDVEAQQVLLAEATAGLQAAQAARQRQAAADARRDARVVSLADLAKAARLGIIPIDVYTAALTARGYSADDVALETDVLTQEIANTRAAQAKHDQAAGVAKAKALSLAQLDAAVIDGLLTLDAYTQRVIALGFSADDAKLIAGVVADKAAVVQAAAARRAALATDDPQREAGRAEQEKAVKAGIETIDDYRAWLTAQKFGADDVDLLVALLQSELDKAAAKAGGGP